MRDKRLVKATMLLGLALLAPGIGAAQDDVPGYKNAKLPIEQRVADLLGRMTLEEKCAQLAPPAGRVRPVLDTTGKYDEKSAGQMGAQLYSPFSKIGAHDAAVYRNAVQRYLVEKTRLGIPDLLAGESLHGFMSYGATSFPQALALASTFDPALVKRVFTAAADEMASAGTDQAFTPVLDLARDPRWGRTEETYGEDPYLGSRMGVAAIEGMQGPNVLIDRHHVMATAKHFAVHGAPEGGTNTAPGNYSERIIRESYLAAFQAAVVEGAGRERHGVRITRSTASRRTSTPGCSTACCARSGASGAS